MCAVADYSSPKSCLGLSYMNLGTRAASCWGTVSSVCVGFVRLAMTKAAGYQEHVGEYGEHWNFFFTLAAIATLTAAVRLPPAALLPAGCFVLTAHQASAAAPSRGLTRGFCRSLTSG